MIRSARTRRLSLLACVAAFALTALIAACATPASAPTSALTATAQPTNRMQSVVPTAPSPTANLVARTAMPTATLFRTDTPTTPTATVPKVRIKIMPLGDSITFGWPDTTYGGYRHLLWTLLTNDGYLFDFVGSQKSGEGAVPEPDNEGHPGWTITQLKNGIDSQGWLETYQPDLILLHIGRNDIDKNEGAAAPANLAALLDDILTRLPKVRVIVAQIIPPRAGAGELDKAYAAAIPGIVATKQSRVWMVDMQHLLTPSDYADGIHPNASGYDKMARAWEPAIQAIEPMQPISASLVTGSVKSARFFSGKASTTVQVTVDFAASSAAGEVKEMRVIEVDGGKCFSEAEMSQVVWEPLVAQKKYSVSIPPTPTNTPIDPYNLGFAFYAVSAQYRDSKGNLSPVYCAKDRIGITP